MVIGSGDLIDFYDRRQLMMGLNGCCRNSFVDAGPCAGYMVANREKVDLFSLSIEGQL